MAMGFYSPAIDFYWWMGMMSVLIRHRALLDQIWYVTSATEGLRMGSFDMMDRSGWADDDDGDLWV